MSNYPSLARLVLAIVPVALVVALASRQPHHAGPGARPVFHIDAPQRSAGERSEGHHATVLLTHGDLESLWTAVTGLSTAAGEQPAARARMAAVRAAVRPIPAPL